ncbi:sulfatase [Lutimonas saemankumensis]|uniref:sulfatase n=1 Tax=Lutimonas saemankumensis TaxID=483016 RepID=UPI001CD5AB94|nr:sulfatase [Lutimonas saemankumensis]MCA0932473.1 sulfatase [Lutimonas saemankumensis]
MINKITLLVLTVLVMGCSKSTVSHSELSKPNVVLILVDDLGWTDLGVYGSDLYQSPNIDNLASEGVRFTNSYSSCTVCSPTRASIVTGKYPARNNVTDWIEGHKYPWAKFNVPDWNMSLSEEEYTMAEAFKDAGYKTAHFGKWHLGEKEVNWPENHGFDVNIAGWKKGSPNLNKKTGTKGYFSPYGNPRIEDGPEGEYLTERLSNEVINFIDQNADKPFFINFWLYNVHTPLQAKQDKIDKYKDLVKAETRHRNVKYAAMVEHTDDAVGKIINKLKEKGLYENTIILFSSDNGGLIGRSKNPVTNNYPLRTGKGDIYEGGVRIPTIIYTPNSSVKGIKIDDPIISMDYYPTLMELAGITSDKTRKQTIDGKSLASLIHESTPLDRDAVYWHYPHYHQEGGVPYSSIRYKDFKLIQNFENDTFELYNLQNDIGESVNVIKEFPEEFELMKDKLEAWRQDVKAQYVTPNPDYIKKLERKKAIK